MAAIIVPKGTFCVTIDEIKRRLRSGNPSPAPETSVTSETPPQSTPFEWEEAPRTNSLVRREVGRPHAIRVPKGTFHISIDELKRQLRKQKVGVGQGGLQSGSGSGSQQGQPGPAPSPSTNNSPPGAIRVPKGTFHKDYICEFEEAAPFASYHGVIDGEQVWTEWIADPVTGAQVQLAYTTRDKGRSAEAWCIEPNMQDHEEDMHDCHCYEDGRLCTDLHGVRRTLLQKRARAVLWVTGFCQYLLCGRFQVDEV